MLSYEEFEDLCNRMDAELAAEQARQGKFIEALEKALIYLSIQHYPETEPYRHLFIEALTIKAHQRAVEVNELLDSFMGDKILSEQTIEGDYQTPARDVSLEEEQFLAVTLKNLPPEQHQNFIQLNTERVEIEAEEREFLFLCHDKTKELIFKYFPEIINLSGNTIRYINFSTYFDIDEWLYDFYYFAGV